MKHHNWQLVITVDEPTGKVWKCNDCHIAVWSCKRPTLSSIHSDEPYIIRYDKLEVEALPMLCHVPIDCNEGIALGVIER